ncbi:hypothetical protein DSM106972_047710 [Dulcicalothrix desertica PCC 7102]|uniref:CHAT domain-containing protein n=1 Tax=Dulcicalothrix desertica PCC 7102 TaxID=232991 RepID=A0A3S1IX06_9CYAN|nr:CHAT domain-containing tetratricopeptide repeat protein [Dulcicalothrix desertica]RUT03857.1 hypothetical protein DSM106972_047710 [Dulcicalothrix desertica PCC 7102]TWH43732.1 hypothetical protein CAL7102_07476 [Dulcicalothrix desertica PCC 7102]
MAGSSLIASQKGIQRAKNSLKAKSLTQKALAVERGIASWSTINHFFNGLPVQRRIFIEICEELDLPSNVWRTLNNIAVLYETQGRYTDAEKKYLEALEMIQHLEGSEHYDVAATLNNLAVLYNSQGRFKEAETNYLQVISIWEKLLDDEHTYIASTLNNLANTYQEQGKYSEAEQTHLKSLSMRKSLFGDEHPDVGMSLSNLADIYLIQARYLEAEQNYLAVLSIQQSIFDSNHPETAKNLGNLAVVYSYQARYQEAENLYLEASSIWERSVGRIHPDNVNNLQNFAKQYKMQGRYSEAEVLFLDILEIRIQLLGQQHPDIAFTKSELAEVYRMQGRYVEAEQMHLDALSMRQRIFGEHPDVAASLNNLAVLYETTSKYSQAESMLLQAISLITKIFGANNPQIASSLNNLAAVYNSQGKYTEAEPLYFKALQIRKSLFGEQHPDVASSLNNIAELYRLQERYIEAEQKHTEALFMRQRFLGDEHPDVAKSLNNLATVYAATGRYTDALSYRVRAGLINDKLIARIFAFSSDSDRLAFVEKIRGNLDFFLSLVCKHLSDCKTAQQEALDFVFKRKALTASALASYNQALYSSRYPHLQEQFRQLIDLNARLIKLHLFIDENDNLIDGTVYQQQTVDLEKQYNILQKQLASQVPEIQLLQQPPNRHTVASALPVNSVLIEFVRFNVFNFHAIPANSDDCCYESRYAAFILPAGQPAAVQMVDLGKVEPIDYLIAATHLEASDYRRQTLAWGKKNTSPKLQIKQYNPGTAINLTQILLQPILNIVSNYKHLILAPDATLNLLPFQILPIDDSGTRLLIDEYKISYLGVGGDILRENHTTTRTASAPIIFADPDFDLTDTSSTFVSSPLNIQPDKQDFVNTLGDVLSQAPGTRLLGESIAQKLESARLYIGEEACETNLMSAKAPSIMLIATHGLFLPDSRQQLPDDIQINRLGTSNLKNPMLRSGLALAGANTWLRSGKLPKKAGKGFVFAQDIASLDLWANELTVLSACDTGRGDLKIGEGVFGLRRAFAVAGTKTLVMSLWQVPDKATALLMDRFFDNLKLAIKPLEALQNAQNYVRTITVSQLQQSALGIEVLKELLQVNDLSIQTHINCDPTQAPLQHPFYWGAWICQGN